MHKLLGSMNGIASEAGEWSGGRHRQIIGRIGGQLTDRREGGMMPEPSQTNVEEVFKSLDHSGWKLTGQKLSGGGQADVLVVVDSNNRKGVFRYLRSEDLIDVRRFNRELRILTDSKFEHFSIIKILEHTKDETKHWYISELGQDFKSHWDEAKERLKHRPDELVMLAVKYIAGLADGLAPLHDVGVVHRDIKPKNMVVVAHKSTATPALIDFGLVYHPEEERLTDVAEAVGNQRFSPDVQMRRLENVPPWLDIFNLVQVLIWMVQEKPAKNWQRALHWRWVNYDPRLSSDLTLSLRALSAACSEEETSPSTSRQFLKLLKELFPMTSPNEKDAGIDVSAILAGIARGKAEQVARDSEELGLMATALPSFEKVYHDLRMGLEKLFEALQDSKVPLKKSIDTNPSINLTVLYQLDLGDGGWTIRVNPWWFRHEKRLPDTTRTYGFYLQSYSGAKDFPNKTLVVTLEKDGTLKLWDEHFKSTPQKVDTVSLVELVRGWVNDGKAWETISARR